jgi:putative peptidoglycan lipid II flippase
MREDSHRTVARAAALVMVAFSVSRLLGLVRQMVFGAYFGTSPEADAYVAAVKIPDTLFLVVAGGALGSAFIPLFTERLAHEDRKAAWSLASSIVNILITVLMPVSLLCILLAPWLVRVLVAPALSPDVQARTVELMRVMLISPTIFGVSGIVMGALNAHQHFLLPAIAPVVYNLGLIVGAVWGGLTDLGVMGPAIGMVVGAVGHLMVQLPGLLRFGGKYVPTFGLDDPAVRKVGLLIAPRMLGVAAFQINMIVISNLASRLGTGAISALEYGWRLMLLPQGIFAQAVGTAVFPTFSTQAARGQASELRNTLLRTLRLLMALTVPASVGLAILGTPIIVLIFQRGVFDVASTRNVSWALGFFAVGLVGHSALEILGRAFYAMHDTWTPAGAAIIAVLLNGVLGLLLPPVFERLGWLPIGGLALATAIAALVEAGLLVVRADQRLGGVDAGAFLQSAWRVIVASGAMAVVLLVFLRQVPDLALAQVGVGIPLGVATYGLIAWLLGVRELRDVTQLLFRRFVTR